MSERAGGSRDAGERREQMLRAALEVIIERGYAETRIADVAERTGTSPALVIYYFKTRDQLLRRHVVRRVPAADGGDPDRRRPAGPAHRHELPARHRPRARRLLDAVAGPVGVLAAEPGGRRGAAEV